MRNTINKVIVVTLIVLLSLSTPVAYAANQTENRINEMNYDEVMQLYIFLEERFDDLKSDIAILDEKINNLESEISYLTKDIKKLEDENAKLKEENKKLKKENDKYKEEERKKKEEEERRKEEERLAKLPPTLRLMDGYDYVGSSTTSVKYIKTSLKDLNKGLAKYGKLQTAGMPYKEYKEAMSYKWKDLTEYNKKPSKINIDLAETINYKTYVDTLKKLSRYDGVYLYDIGKSTDGRTLYAIDIDVESKNKDKNVIMLSGSIHAREFAGGNFTLKMLVDLVQEAQTSKKAMDILKNNKFVSVPIINVDVREGIINNQKKWTTSGGQIYKAYSNGVDSNRNFPGLSWRQLAKGNKLPWNLRNTPGFSYYSGDYAGSNNETKAMMKWLYHYVVIEEAECLLDMHQQGRVIYADKPWATSKQQKAAKDLRKSVLNIINKGNSHKYRNISDVAEYGLNGDGVTITDYAVALASGAKFSPTYGFLVMENKGKEYTLMELKNLDNAKFDHKAPNEKFATLTVEIGYGSSYLGNTANARKNNKAEYTKYHFNELLKALPGLLK